MKGLRYCVKSLYYRICSKVGVFMMKVHMRNPDSSKFRKWGFYTCEVLKDYGKHVEKGIGA